MRLYFGLHWEDVGAMLMMDTFVNEKDFLLLNYDRYTFEVLKRIIRGDCELILTNHQDLMICHSESPYPVWIWTPDDVSDEVKENAWTLMNEVRPLTNEYRINLKYELAEYFLAKAARSGMNVSISTNLFAYDCPSPKQPDITSDGSLYCCTLNDVEEAAQMVPGFYTEIGDEAPSHERCAEKMRAYIERNALYFWKNGDGKTVACCSYKTNDQLACLGSVYTFPDERRKHYAQNLVYQVTQIVSELGYMPMLYTDADYCASNSCYEKIGYTLRGKLCTISLK